MEVLDYQISRLLLKTNSEFYRTGLPEGEEGRRVDAVK